MTESEQQEFKETVRKVDRLYDLLWANGFVQSVKDMGEDMKEVKGEVRKLATDFAVFTAGRAETCPFKKDRKEERRQRWLVFGVVFAGGTSTAALVTLFLRIGGVV